MSQLVLGFGLIFRLDDESVERHRALSSAASTVPSEAVESESTLADAKEDEEELEVDEEGQENGEESSESTDEKEEFPDVQVSTQFILI